MSISIYRNANIQKLLCGQALAQICDRMTSIGLVWVITEKFGAQFVPWFLACAGLPHLLLAKTAAQSIVKHSALPIVIRADLFRCLIYLAVTALLGFNLLSASTTMLFSLVIATNCAAAIFNPAILTLPMKLAEGEALQALNGAMNSFFSLASVIGPLLAAILYAWKGLPILFLVTMFAYGFAGILSLQISLPNEAANVDAIKQSPKLWTAFNSTPIVKTMLILFLGMNMFLGPLQIALPAYAKNIYFGTIQALAYLECSLGSGMVLGGLLLSFLKIPGQRLQQIFFGLVAMALFYIFFALSKNIYLGLLSVFCMGLVIGFANVLVVSEFQERPKAEFVPGIMAIVNIISVASIPFSMLAAGLILRFYSVPQFIISCSCSLLLFNTLSIFVMRRQKEVNHAH